jgi:cell surface protein SprA
MMKKTFLPFGLLCLVAMTLSALDKTDGRLYVRPVRRASAVDTAALDTVPLKDRKENFLLNPKRNPFDLPDPKTIEKKVEYNPNSDSYLIEERIGEDYYRPPSEMGFEEYLRYRQKEDENRYFRELASKARGKDGKNPLDPFSKIDVKKDLIDRLFGGNTISINPQGNVDLLFGYNYQKLDNPVLNLRSRNLVQPDFNMNIQMNLEGKIGEKLNINTNYNTQATFDFDQIFKINYNSDLFSEDEILKKIEAGNVTLPLRGSLIQGVQNLFGLKTELQFGHLRLTGLVASQRSQRKDVRLQGGSQVQEFEIRATDYEEDRHFLLSHYNREAFDGAMTNLPQIRSLFKLEYLDVWVTNTRGETENVREIVALADLGEGARDWMVDKSGAVQVNSNARKDISQRYILPDNRANDLYQKLTVDSTARESGKVTTLVERTLGLDRGNANKADAYIKVNARRLRPSEFTFHPELGFISMKVNLQADDIVGVSYQYTYNGKTFTVGEPAFGISNTRSDTARSTQVLFVKMLKGINNNVKIPTWDLMMKNFYSTGASQVDPKEFRFDIVYDDPGKGDKRFLPKELLTAGNQVKVGGRPLLRLFNLDTLNVQGDPFPDGVFDFVPELTIYPTTGRVMFPVLEPFGRSLAAKLGGVQEDVDRFVFAELYREAKLTAEQFPEKNRFLLKGRYKGTNSREIYLGFNVPPGSVRVTAGGQLLLEGADYTVDYGIGKVTVLNDAILSSGTPVNVSFEDNALFGFQNRTMLGLRADYQVNKDFNIGATALRLYERPFTQKVNIGDDPINNAVYGLDVNFKKDLPFLTKMVNALPGISTKATSSIAFAGEVAAIRPGHARAINQNRLDDGGVVYVDDFEGANNTFDMRQPVNQWFLASVPQGNPLFLEGNLVNNLAAGANRAKMSWYRIDNFGVRNANDNINPYTRVIQNLEVFRNQQLQPTDLPNIQTLDMVFNPNLRGPYNFDLPGGYRDSTGRRLSAGLDVSSGDIRLLNPASRWGGIMRAMNTTDFLTANIEYLEFWMLSPFLDENGTNQPSSKADRKQGKLLIHLGSVSEDILRDSKKFFENGMPSRFNPNRETERTNWGLIPRAQQITNSFDNDEESRVLQDVGLDGLADEQEREKFAPYLNALNQVNSNAANSARLDPSADNFRFFNDPGFPEGTGVIERYRDFNNPQNNSQTNTTRNQFTSGTNIPDAEDLDLDNTLNEAESYYEYEIPIRRARGNSRELDPTTPYITDTIVSSDGRRIWYRIRVPLQDNNRKSFGGINGFRAIRFMRLVMTGFEEETVLRFARMEFVRNQWLTYKQDLSDSLQICSEDGKDIVVDAVNIEENSSRKPFNYVLPVGIQREQQIGGVIQAFQNEQSLTLTAKSVCDGKEKAVFKTVNMDMRVYDRLKMFVHAERFIQDGQPIPLEDKETKLFVRIGSDFKNNYYEYEIPLTLSEVDRLPAPQPGGRPVNGAASDEYKLEVWKPENNVDIPLDTLIEIKKQRNLQGISSDREFVVNFSRTLASGVVVPYQMKVRGNPNLGNAKTIMVGIRNPRKDETDPTSTDDGRNKSVVVWINELRLTGLDERGGIAAIGRLDVQLADFGNITVAGNYGGIGYGSIEQKVQQRSRRADSGIDLAANFELGQMLPEKWRIRLPFYAQYSKQTSTPEFDPYDKDLNLREKIRSTSAADRDSVSRQTQEIRESSSINFTNVGKERNPEKQSKPAPWDISNFTANYGVTTETRSDPMIGSDENRRQSGGLNYTYSRNEEPIKPFKNLKGNWLKLISELNFNPIPGSFMASTLLDRRFQRTSYRFTGLDETGNTFFNKRFTWDRNYNLQWGLTQGLKLVFNANNAAVIDEPNEVLLLERFPDNPVALKQYRQDSVWNNIRDFGRTKNYTHDFTLTYTAPTKLLPILEWIQARGTLRGEYGWTAAALNMQSLGNVIQNGQVWQANIDFNFDQLYGKVPYLRKIDQARPNAPKKKGERPESDRVIDPNEDDSEKKDKKKTSGEPSLAERMLIRPFLLLRKARFNYTENRGTVLPGFTPQARMFGMQNFEAPGWDFIAGWQPRIRELQQSEEYTDKDWLHQNSLRGWMSADIFQNQEVVQNFSQDYDARLTVEPFRDFRVDFELKRNYVNNHNRFFKDTLDDGNANLVHAVPTYFGSMSTSFMAVNTLFGTDLDQLKSLFQVYEANRVIISQRLAASPQLHSNPFLAQQGYRFGYGENQAQVTIPAFIAAYTGRDARGVDLDVFDLMPMVNWRMTYNGLSRLPLFRDFLQSFSLSHGYKSTLTINSYSPNLQFFNEPLDREQNFQTRLIIPEVQIQEGFAPLVAFNAVFQNGMGFNFDYKFTRNLAFSTLNSQLQENRVKDVTFGFNHTIKDFDINKVLGGKKRKPKKPSKPANPQPGGLNPNGNNTISPRSLVLAFNFSLRDDITIVHQTDLNQVEPTRGSYNLRFSPTAEYKLNQRLSLRFAFDYTKILPKTSASFPQIQHSGNVTLRFSLN